MKKEILEKWDNTCIKVLSTEHGARVIKFWKSIGVDTSTYSGNVPTNYYGIFDDVFTLRKSNINVKTITLEEAIAIRDKDIKTFPREMYVWDNEFDCGEVVNVVAFDEKNCQKYKVMGITKGHYWQAFLNSMEIEEYEALNKKQNENAELIKQIEKTEKELAELKSKLK